MKDTQRAAFVIFSVFQATETPDKNFANHVETCAALEHSGIKFKIVEGSYKGKTEQSILVSTKYQTHAFNLAQHYNQETILSVSAKRIGYLIGVKRPTVQNLGWWREVSRTEAVRAGNFTYDRKTEKFYVCGNKTRR